MFDGILGNEPIKAYLEKAIREERLAQTLLFSGIDGIGKKRFAKALAKKLLQSERSTDFHHLLPEGKSGLFAIETLRTMIDKDHSAPYEGVGKVFLLEDVHRMQPAAANALLKTLEEPSEDSTFILLTSKMDEILPTILSRATVLKFQPLKLKEIETLLHDRGLSIEFAKFSHGSFSKALQLAEKPEFEAQQKTIFELLSAAPIYPEVFKQLGELEKSLESMKEEDPVSFAAQVEHLFTLILMWHRDQHVRLVGKNELLFFPDQPKREPLSMEKVQERVNEARLAFARNMKLSHSLAPLFCKL